ncbi:uncharacterized protein LOC119068400 [Bradysia coprophila]|uniref:uncharacterized protein LOC119068400 n=1 Tax=Bradysia coprophila TaxID=38358 RepID=UPI00187D7D48|nr:uncharacterized protein LOC119068400 [Bradysia coprophila]
MTLRRSLPALGLILGVLSCSHFATAKKGCEALKTEFSKDTQSFTACALNHAEPVTYCEYCGQEFAKVILHYNELFANETCRAKYFDRDRINIVEMVYSNAQSVWNAGSCSNCYDWVDGKINQTLSNTTTKFFDEMEVFGLCLKKYKDETACTNCLESYNSVNGIYKNIQKTFNDNLCFDIKDSMNKTRLNWSHDLKCCKDRKTSLTTFTVTSVVISVFIPFVFYTSFMFFGWRREQIQEPLADSDVHHPSDERTETFEAIGPSTVPAITHLLDL